MEDFVSQKMNVKKQKENSANKKKVSLKKPLALLFTLFFFIVVFCLVVAILFFTSLKAALNQTNATPLTVEQSEKLESTLNEAFPKRTSKLLTDLPYPVKPANLDIASGSAILVDVETGSVLFEKNADMKIPPASMTKIVEMYVVLEAVENGKVSLDDEVPLPKESWAVNLPSDASIMFLAEGQHVTLRELLLGLAVASGNDASIAVANFVGNNMEDFVAKMNESVKRLGLTQTHFVESSGYSEQNITTAREFATFAREYIRRFPFALSEFHAQKELRYPLEKNLPDNRKSKGDSEAVIQYNTNKLLGLLDGCDGLKTGFIYESGYNISVTAERNGTRFLSVTMKGPGSGSVQGNKWRIHDNTEMLEFAFANFADYKVSPSEEHSFSVGVFASSQKAVRLVPAWQENFTVPRLQGSSAQEAVQKVTVRAEIPRFISEDVLCGQACGYLVFQMGETILQKIPLVSDRDSRIQNKTQKLLHKICNVYLKGNL